MKLPLALVLALPLSAQEPAPPTGATLQLGLDDALRIALAKNIGLEVAQLAADMARHDALGSWGAFDPLLTVTGSTTSSEVQGSSSLAGANVLKFDDQDLSTSLDVPFRTGGSLSLSYSRNNQETNNQFANFNVATTDSVSVALTQPLLRGAWARFATTNQRSAEIERERQRHIVRETREQLLLDVMNAYWDLVSAREQVEVRRIALQLGERQLAQDERRLEVGVGTEVDVLQARTNVSQQEEQLLSARFALRAAEDGLRVLLFQRPRDEEQGGLDAWDVPIEPLTPLPGVAEIEAGGTQPVWTRSLGTALEERPLLWQRRLEIEAAEVLLEASHSDREHQLDLTLSAASSGFAPNPSTAFQTAIDFDFPTTSAALTWSLPLMNRTAREAVHRARAGLRSAHLSYAGSELAIVAGVRAAVRDVVHRTEAVAAASRSLDLARRQLEAEEARYGEGLSTTFQVLEFQRDLAEALSAERSARADHAKAEAALRHAEGRLGAELE